MFIPVGGTLDEVESIDLSTMDECLKNIPIVTMCDIDNPFYGPEGAIAVYGPQKGADEKMVAEAVDMMRYVEDQFVVWGRYPEWNIYSEQKKIWKSPAGLEQYFCYCPIDSSSATILNAFLNMYILKKDRLYLEKAMALADTITRVQDKETGRVPTFFIGENCEEGYRNFWINCQIHTATIMMRLADVTEDEGIE